MPGEQQLRALHDAFSRGDMDTVLSYCTEDIVFHVPGHNQVAGEYKGRDAFLEMVGKVMQLSGGTFREELLDALANDRHGVALAYHTLERSGKKHEYHTVHVWRVRGDKYCEWFEHPGETAAFDAAWS